ncbi:hypothetical protein [Nonomuraea dietziae]|uniref:hypothetical protein n=1 Tax=Nonomuraea dietziae TaxID=65515 RepID=UPI003438F852
MIRAQLQHIEQAIPARTPIRTWPEYWQHIEAQRRGQVVPRPTGHNPTVHAYARVDYGRWIADCPWGCGAAHNLPAGADSYWCTECAGGGWGHTAALVWPDQLDKLTTNLESLPVVLQFWPCIGCRNRLGDGSARCPSCRGMQGVEVDA